jgi:hypothetical protein
MIEQAAVPVASIVGRSRRSHREGQSASIRVPTACGLESAPAGHGVVKVFSQSRLAPSSQGSVPVCQPASSEFWLPPQSPVRRM